MQHLTRTILVTSLLLAACGDGSTSFNQGMTFPLKPVGLKSSLLFVDTTGHRGFLLDASASKKQALAADAKRVELPYGPTGAERRNGDSDEALVLCAGRLSSADAHAESAALTVVTHDAKLRTYDLGTTPFDTLVQSDDGLYAVVFRAKPDSGRLLNNANELVVVNLDAEPGTDGARTHKTPRSFGHTPTSAVFSPSTQLMHINGEDRRLLVVLSASEVTLIDLNHLDRRETVVQLGAAQSSTVNPEQVLFGTDEPTLYIRGSASDDIFMFRLEPHTNDTLGNDFQPSINQLGGGSGPRDMALFAVPQAAGSPPSPPSPRLLVVSRGNAQALVVDPSSSKATAIQLPGAADHILLFTTNTSPTDDTQQPHAFLYGDSNSTVFFLDLADIEARKDRNLEPLTLVHSIGKVILLTDENKLALLHPSPDTGVSLLDLQKRTIEPISSNATLVDASFDVDAKRLWVAPANQNRVDTLDLADGPTNGATNDVLLDREIESVVPLFAAGRFAVIHPSGIGDVTFIDSAKPSRDNTAISVRGFLIANALDRGAP